MNRAMLYGNLGADPEVIATKNGGTVLKLRLATSYRVKRDEQWVDETEWHRVTVFGNRAETLGRMLHKGEKIAVEGRIHTSSYEKNGEKRYSTEIIADQVYLAGKGGRGGDEANEREPERAPAAERAGADDDDIPFS